MVFSDLPQGGAVLPQEKQLVSCSVSFTQRSSALRLGFQRRGKPGTDPVTAIFKSVPLYFVQGETSRTIGTTSS